jgi:hypothetical protein
MENNYQNQKSPPHSKRTWKPFWLNNELILEKSIWLEGAQKIERESVEHEFYIYYIESSDWFL